MKGTLSSAARRLHSTFVRSMYFTNPINEACSSKQRDRLGLFIAGERFGAELFDQGDSFADAFQALQRRWEDRLTGKDFHALGESYRRGRCALVCYFELPRLDVADHVEASASLNLCSCVEHVLALTIQHLDSVDFCQSDNGDDQVVFVDVVQLPDLRTEKIASKVRLDLHEKQPREAREGFSYATVRRLTSSGLAGHEGLTETVPGFLGWETYASRRALSGPHHSGRDVIQRRTECMKAVSKAQDEVCWNRLGLSKELLASGLKVRLFPQYAEVGFEIPSPEKLRLAETMVGPLDF